jgi:hypothetical protein
MITDQQLPGHRPRLLRSIIVALVIALGLVGVASQPALAHTRVEIGPYVIVLGWLQEPAIVGERNALTLEITVDESPVVGAESSLDAELLYAGRAFRTNLVPSLTPGLYTAEIFPTVRGQYEIHLFGTLGDLEIDETLEPEEVFPASRIQFPEPQPDLRDLQREWESRLAQVESQLQTARVLAIGGLATGLIGIGLAAFTLWRRPR